MIDDDGWWFMMMGIQYISRYQIWSNQEQVRETYVNGSHTPPSDRNRKKTTRSSPKTKQSGHSQRSSVRTYKVHQDHQDHQGQTKHHKTPAFRMVQRYMAQLHGSTMTVTMVHTELQVIEIDMSNIDGNASRLNPSADCTAALEGFSFQPQCMQHSIQFPAVQSTGKKTKHRQDGQSYSLAPCDAMWFQSADFFHAFCFELRH